MPTWRPPDRGDKDEAWTWRTESGRVLATVRRDQGRGGWDVYSSDSGRVGWAPTRRLATAMLTVDKVTGSAVLTDAKRRERGEASRAVAIKALGFDDEHSGMSAGDRYAASTGELMAWAREGGMSEEDLDAEVERYLRDSAVPAWPGSARSRKR